MLKKKMVNVKIIDLKRLNNSIYGNPRWEITLSDDNFCKLYFCKTVSNGAIGYRICSSDKGARFDFIFHETKNGNIILDYIAREY